MPDDLFTACLTTPLRIALLHHNLQTFPLTTSDSGGRYTQRSAGYMAAFWDSMSTDLKDRLGSELQAILRTIAWQTLDGSKYQLLFGQSGDVVSGLAAGFLLSQRVMSTYRAHPESIPSIPSSTSHALWTTWDLILDNLFEQLPPYFDDDQSKWEDSLKLVSFMDDQLTSILESDRPLTDPVTGSRTARNPHAVFSGLSRLPILCQAALTPEFRHRAVTALDNCLCHLDVRGIAHAVQGGALDVAAQLLALDDDEIAAQMISIWASLIRHESCVSLLASNGQSAERLTGSPSVSFFLDALERHLGECGADARRAVCQTAAVLSTITNYVNGRSSPRFVARTLTLGSKMLGGDNGLVAQWGALLIAQVLDSIHGTNSDASDAEEILELLQEQLLEMINSPTVENRASAIYALGRWIDKDQATDLGRLESQLELTLKIEPHCQSEGSALVRKTIVRLLGRILSRAGRWSKLVLWRFLVKAAVLEHTQRKGELHALCEGVDQVISTTEHQEVVLTKLEILFQALERLRLDPNQRLANLVNEQLETHVQAFKPLVSEGEYARLLSTFLPDGDRHWNDQAVDLLVSLGGALMANWIQLAGQVAPKPADDNEFFQRSKISLQAYLAVSSLLLIIPHMEPAHSYAARECPQKVPGTTYWPPRRRPGQRLRSAIPTAGRFLRSGGAASRPTVEMGGQGHNLPGGVEHDLLPQLFVHSYGMSRDAGSHVSPLLFHFTRSSYRNAR